jgi:predicted RND superfamily exporter protein
MGWQEALDSSDDHAGRAAVITSILLVSGYAVLMAGSGTMVFDFGLLTTIAAAAALVGDLLLLPLLLKPFSQQVAI